MIKKRNKIKAQSPFFTNLKSNKVDILECQVNVKFQ